MSECQVAIEPFSAAAYAPFGTPLLQPPRAPDGREEFNAAWLLPTDLDGRPQWVYQRAFRQPLRVSTMERHHNVAQLFVPVSRKAFIMVVAPPTGAGKDAPPDPSAVRAFHLDGSFGLIIDRGIWHALDRLPVDSEHVDFFFVTELETQEDMSRHAADHPERLERSDIVRLEHEIVLVDRDGPLPAGQKG